MLRFLFSLTRHPVSLAGTVLTTVSALLFLILYAIELVGFEGGPYLGIVTFVLLPAIFVLGLILIPLGLWRLRGRAGEAEGVAEFPVLDLNRVATRRNVFIVIVATVVNLAIVAVATYKGVEYSDSTVFCGEVCHEVMAPEFTTYQRSPHSRVSCVECHIGPGADWFVKSKMSGAWQVVATTFDLYPRPIPAPVHNLRPARDTCEQCHWPTKFVGDRLKVITRFQEDEENTETKTVLLLRVGGMAGRSSEGIHWHVDPNILIRYRADESRETIHEVELVAEDGTRTRYLGSEASEGDTGEEGSWRVMDCVDCHNRPTHIYRLPGPEIDDALLLGRIDRSLPYIKREGMKALQEEYASQEEAETRIPDRIRTFYADRYPELSDSKADAIRQASAALVAIHATNVHPGMNISWGTYPNHIGHEETPGCYRCHNDEHATEDGQVISQDCETCHTLLALEEEEPEILESLKP